MTKKKTIRCRKGLSHKIQTKPFESLEVIVAIDDVIEYANEEDKKKQLNKISDLLVADFKDTFKTVCESLEVEPKSARAVHKSGGAEKETSVSTKSDKKKTSKALTDDELDDFFDELN